MKELEKTAEEGLLSLQVRDTKGFRAVSVRAQVSDSKIQTLVADLPFENGELVAFMPYY